MNASEACAEFDLQPLKQQRHKTHRLSFPMKILQEESFRQVPHEHLMLGILFFKLGVP